MLDPNDLRTLFRAFDINATEVDGFTIDTHAQAKLFTGPLAHTLLFGVDYQHYEFDQALERRLAPPIDIFNPVFGASLLDASIFFQSDTNTEQEQIGLYVQDQLKLYDRWVLTLGGRYDWVDSALPINLLNKTDFLL